MNLSLELKKTKKFNTDTHGLKPIFTDLIKKFS